MEVFAKRLPIPKLIAELDNHMVNIGYANSTMSNFREFWHALQRHAEKDGIEYLTKDVGFQLLKDHYGIDPYELHLGVYHSSIRRAMMLLLEYQISGCIAGGIQRSSYIIPEEFVETVEQYLFHLKNEKLSRDGTIKNHRKCVAKALCFFYGHNIKVITDINSPEIETNIVTMAGLSKAYISTTISILRRFFEFVSTLNLEYKSPRFPSVLFYKDRKIPEYYTSDEIQASLNAIDRANTLGKRDYAMVLIGVRYGLRIGDIRKLQLNEINFQQNTINIIQQKTQKPLIHPLLPDVGWAVIDYLKNGRPNSSSSYVFLRHVVPFEKIGDNDNMEYTLRKYATAAGIMKSGSHKKSSFHMLRYSLASDLLSQNVSLTTISGILGHSELNITSRYTQLDIEHLRECALEVPNEDK